MSVIMSEVCRNRLYISNCDSNVMKFGENPSCTHLVCFASYQ